MKRYKKLSTEELKSFPDFENFTQEELENEIRVLESLSILFYELFMKESLNDNVKPLKQNQQHETEQRHAA